MDWTDTVELSRRLSRRRRRSKWTLRRAFLDRPTLTRLVRTTRSIPPSLRGDEYVGEYEQYVLVGEYPYWSIGHGLITRGVRSRRFRYLYDGVMFRSRVVHVAAAVMVYVPVLAMLPPLLLGDGQLTGSWSPVRRVSLVYAALAPALFVTYVVAVVLHGVTPNPYKRAVYPVLSWYVLTTFVPLAVLLGIWTDTLRFDTSGASGSGNDIRTTLLVTMPCFPLTNLAIFTRYSPWCDSRVGAWWSRLDVEHSYLSRPGRQCMVLAPFVVVFSVIVELGLSGMMYAYAENRTDALPEYVVAVFLWALMVLSSTSTLFIAGGVSGATYRNRLGAPSRAAQSRRAPMFETALFVVLLMLEVFKVGFTFPLIVSAALGYRELNTLDAIVYYLVVFTGLAAAAELAIFIALGSRLYLIRKFKRRMGYHPAPFEETVPSSLPYESRKRRQEGSDEDTDSEISGLDDGESSSMWSDEDE